MKQDDPQVGEMLPDGRICAGISPRTGKNMYVGDTVHGDYLTWEEAKVAMTNLAPFGWRLPTRDEMSGLRLLARCADEKDSDPFRQQRLPTIFRRAESGTASGLSPNHQSPPGLKNNGPKTQGPG